MDRWIRWTVALGVFAVVFGASLAAAGASDPKTPEDSPAFFGIEPSRPGDRGLYKTALVVVTDGNGDYYDMNARFAFERLDDRLMLDRDGRIVPVSSFVAEWQSEPFRFPLREILRLPELPSLSFPDCWPDAPSNWMDERQVQQYEDAMEACGEEYGEAGERFGDEMEAWGDHLEISVEAWASALDDEFHTVRASDWHVTHHADNETVATSHRDGWSSIRAVVESSARSDARQAAPASGTLTLTEPVARPGPCGWSSSLQQGPQDMWRPVTVHGECPADMELGFAHVEHEPGPIQVEVSGRDRVAGEPAVVFSMPEDPDRLRLWYSADTPYPVRILTRTTSVPLPVQEALGSDYEAPAFYVLHELVEFEAGQDAKVLAVPATPDLRGDRLPWGPQLGGFEHPWPLHQALADAADPAKAPESCRSWRDWIAAHDASIQFARFRTQSHDEGHNDPVVDEEWHVVAGEGAARRAALLQRHTETVADSPGGPVRPSTIACADAQLPGPLADMTDARLPTVAAAARVLEILSGTQATGYGFGDVCLSGCEAGETWLTVGTSPEGIGGGPTDLLSVGPEGGLRLHAAGGYPEARFSDPAWQPGGGQPWGFKVARSGAWSMPEPATAATLAAGAAGASLLFLLWPALKALLAAPLFSRIRKEDLLEHPLRGQIADVVQGEPGIHFQELVRRLQKGRGTTEHHVRKLVAAGLVVERAHRGFTCYFPKGRVDYRVMAAAPVLKSTGARQVMVQICKRPGCAALEIAQEMGMATSTVNYHIKRLLEAGLIETQRDGRFVRLHGTDLGQQAVGAFAA